MSDLFDSPVRYLITPGSLTPSNFHAEKGSLLETVRLAVSAGIELIQVREKSLTGRQLFELAVDTVDIARGGATRILINERFDIAVAAGADGVHLTSTSIPKSSVRSKVPDGYVIGVSAHSSAEVEAASRDGADFAMLGPIFATPGKGEPLGISELRELAFRVEPFPVIAIGGIDETNSEDVIAAGAAGYASIRYLNEFVRITR